MSKAGFAAALPEAARRPFHGRGRAVKGQSCGFKKIVGEIGGTINLRIAQKIAAEMTTGLFAHL